MSEQEEIRRIKRSILGGQKSWEAANLKVKADGNWLTFYDGNTKKRINSPRLKDKMKYKISYKAKERSLPEQQQEDDVLDTYKYDNYTRLPSRKLFSGTSNNNRQQHIANVELPNLYPKPHEFRGNQPLELPLRYSNLLLNEKRQNEKDQCYSARLPKFTLRSVSPPQTTRRGSIYNSLYQRSLKRDDLEFKWDPQVEEMAKSLYTEKKN